VRSIRFANVPRRAAHNTQQQKGDAAMKTMDELFTDLMQDVYYAEKELTKALPKMAKEAKHENLKKAFSDHLKETEGHIQRLDKAFEMIGKPAKGKKCDAILGIIAGGRRGHQGCQRPADRGRRPDRLRPGGRALRDRALRHVVLLGEAPGQAAGGKPAAPDARGREEGRRAADPARRAFGQPARGGVTHSFIATGCHRP
jgi:hypothetical protein